MSLPLQGVAYEFYVSLADALDPDTFKANPTIAAGDFTISKDGGAYTNLTTIPVVDPAGSVTVRINLNATEMTAEKVNILGIDAVGNEWQNILAALDVPIGTTETLTDIELGDRIESSARLVINRAGTLDTVLDKEIVGSLLSPSVTIRTTDSE